ncbi:MAG: nucleotidyltransferase family protein [Candidatus Micrarchaeia archaeon]
MDSLIMCGGYAKRLEPITEFIPKPLLFVDGAPLIDHIINKVDNLGISNKVISTNLKFEKQFLYWMRQKENRNLKLVVEPTLDHSEKYGAVKGISYAISNAKINNDLLIVAGDNYFDFELTEMKNKFDKIQKPLIALYNVKDVDHAKMFGVVEADDNYKIVGFEEKPDKPKTTLISTGIYMLPSSTLPEFENFLNEIRSSDLNDAIGEFIKWLLKKEEVYGYLYKDGLWEDIGTITSYRSIFYKFL